MMRYIHLRDTAQIKRQEEWGEYITDRRRKNSGKVSARKKRQRQAACKPQQSRTVAALSASEESVLHKGYKIYSLGSKRGTL